MRILVAVAAYSKMKEKPILFYVQERNKYYKSKGIEVTVLNFSTKEDYVIDDIPVICLNTYEKNKKRYDLLICHAPNLRNHYSFLKKHEKEFVKIVFFFHGHEVLMVNKVYAEPYNYVKDSNFFMKVFRNIYDYIKLSIWKNYYSELSYKSHFVFVSKWMYEEFLKWVKIDPEILKDKYSITYNCIGEYFETKFYNKNKNKKYDFVTIRANLDGSKYSIDLINELAINSPNYNFLVVGKGQFFKYNEKAKNIILMDKLLTHAEILDILNDSRCALMLTRTDAQGVMACEMATFGMPLITSNIPVCHEIFDNFENVVMIDNENTSIDLSHILEELEKNNYLKNHMYFKNKTCDKEIKIFKALEEDKINETK